MFPSAPVLTATSATASMANQWALQVFGDDWLQRVPLWSANQEVELLWLRRGSRIVITRNADLEREICNGAAAEVLDVTRAGIIVKLRASITTLPLRTAKLKSQLETWTATAYDISLGFAMAVHKVEGATLEQAILIFEGWACPGWGYTAITRIRRRQGLKTIGRATEMHFTPRD